MAKASPPGKNPQQRPAQAAEEIRSLLKAHGLRYSRPRKVILEFFREGSRHVSAEGVYLALRQRGEDLSLSTVYLNLATLRDAGLIRELSGVNGEALFDSSVEPHDHLICKKTGTVLDLPAIHIDGVPLGRYIKEQVEAQTGWQVDEPRFDLKGVAPHVDRDDGSPAER